MGAIWDAAASSGLPYIAQVQWYQGAAAPMTQTTVLVRAGRVQTPVGATPSPYTYLLSDVFVDDSSDIRHLWREGKPILRQFELLYTPLPGGTNKAWINVNLTQEQPPPLVKGSWFEGDIPDTFVVSSADQAISFTVRLASPASPQ